VNQEHVVRSLADDRIALRFEHFGKDLAKLGLVARLLGVITLFKKTRTQLLDEGAALLVAKEETDNPVQERCVA